MRPSLHAQDRVHHRRLFRHRPGHRGTFRRRRCARAGRRHPGRGRRRAAAAPVRPTALRALRRHAVAADPGGDRTRGGRVRRLGHRLQQRRRRRPARRHGGDDARRLGRDDEPAAALGHVRHDVRAAAPEGARRRRHRQHFVDLGAGHRLRTGGLFHRQGGGAAFQQAVRGRPGAPPHPRQRGGAGLHRHADLRQRLRPGPHGGAADGGHADRTRRQPAARRSRRPARGHRRGGALPGQRRGRLRHRHARGRRRRHDGGHARLVGPGAPRPVQEALGLTPEALQAMAQANAQKAAATSPPSPGPVHPPR